MKLRAVAHTVSGIFSENLDVRSSIAVLLFRLRLCNWYVFRLEMILRSAHDSLVLVCLFFYLQIHWTDCDWTNTVTVLRLMAACLPFLELYFFNGIGVMWFVLEFALCF
jgi:hypothetical protein